MRQVRPSRTPPVMIEQHVDDVFEELRMSRREEAIVNLVNGQLQFWKGLIVFFGLIPVAKGGWMRKEKGASVCVMSGPPNVPFAVRYPETPAFIPTVVDFNIGITLDSNLSPLNGFVPYNQKH